MLYLVCYDQAAEENEDFVMEDRVILGGTKEKAFLRVCRLRHTPGT